MYISVIRKVCIKDNNEELNLDRNAICNIDDRWSKHWFFKALVDDGSIIVLDNNPTTNTPEKNDSDVKQSITEDEKKELLAQAEQEAKIKAEEGNLSEKEFNKLKGQLYNTKLNNLKKEKGL